MRLPITFAIFDHIVGFINHIFHFINHDKNSTPKRKSSATAELHFTFCAIFGLVLALCLVLLGRFSAVGGDSSLKVVFCT